MAPAFVTENNTECVPSSCIVTWKKPDDDGGSDLISYVIMYASPYTTPEGKEIVESGDWQKITIPASSETSMELKNLKPKLKYKIRVYAVNDVGDSPESSDLYMISKFRLFYCCSLTLIRKIMLIVSCKLAS